MVNIPNLTLKKVNLKINQRNQNFTSPLSNNINELMYKITGLKDDKLSHYYEKNNLTPIYFTAIFLLLILINMDAYLLTILNSVTATPQQATAIISNNYFLLSLVNISKIIAIFLSLFTANRIISHYIMKSSMALHIKQKIINLNNLIGQSFGRNQEYELDVIIKYFKRYKLIQINSEQDEKYIKEQLLILMENNSEGLKTIYSAIDLINQLKQQHISIDDIYQQLEVNFSNQFKKIFNIQEPEQRSIESNKVFSIAQLNELITNKHLLEIVNNKFLNITKTYNCLIELKSQLQELNKQAHLLSDEERTILDQTLVLLSKIVKELTGNLTNINKAYISTLNSKLEPINEVKMLVKDVYSIYSTTLEIASLFGIEQEVAQAVKTELLISAII